MIAEWLDRENPVEKADKLKHKINTGMLNDTFILLKSNELLGVIVFKWEGDIGKIGQLYLDPDFTNQGYGGKLLRFSINELLKQQVKKIVLEVIDYNTRAINFYKKFDFEVVGKTNTGIIFTNKYELQSVIMELNYSKYLKNLAIDK